jgi:hypothetical protein
MSPSARRRWSLLPHALFGLIFLLVSSTAIASASVPDSQTGVITGCYSKDLRIIDAQAGDTCKKGETTLTWDQGPTLAGLQDSPCTRSEGDTGYVDIAIDTSDSIHFTCHYGVPHWCDSNTPTVGPHLNVTCNEETDTLSFMCDLGWVDFDGDHANGCEAEGFEATEASIRAYADVYVLGEHDAVLPPQCTGDLTFACPGGVPADPPPTAHLVGANLVVVDNGGGSFDISLDVAATAAGIPVSAFGVDCTLSVDTAAGSFPATTLSGSVDFPPNPTTGITDEIVTSNVQLTNLEAADLTLTGGQLCAAADTLKGLVLNLLPPYFEQYFDVSICRAPDPGIFMLCP